MGSFADAIRLAQATGGPADIAAVRRYQSREGIGLDLEQQVSDDLGLFLRAGWADGFQEPYEFTDIDRTVAAGLSLKGARWSRPDDTLGFGFVVNGISKIHQAFFNDGGLGIVIGDGQLPHYGPEFDPRDLLQRAGGQAREVHLRLPVHRRSGLQPRSRPGERVRRAAARPVLRTSLSDRARTRGERACRDGVQI